MPLTKQDLKDIFNILKPEFTKLHNGITENREAIDRNEKAIHKNASRINSLTNKLNKTDTLIQSVLHKVGDNSEAIRELQIDNRAIKTKLFT